MTVFTKYCKMPGCNLVISDDAVYCDMHMNCTCEYTLNSDGYVTSAMKHDPGCKVHGYVQHTDWKGSSKYDGTPVHYSGEQGDVYDFLIKQYGLETWQRHVEMEVIQYIVRARVKGTYVQDIKKSIVILERILTELERV